MNVLDTSIPKELNTQDEKDPIMFMIQTKDIKQYIKNRSTLRQNIIKLYRLISVQCLPALQSGLEGYPYYSTNFPIYELLWLLTNIKICTYGINHTSNGCYYSVISVKYIFCLHQGRDKPTKAYYRRFESPISISELEKCMTMTQV